MKGSNLQEDILFQKEDSKISNGKYKYLHRINVPC